MSYLLDTNVLSELRKGRRCDPAVAAWFSTIAAEEIFLSVIAIGEIRKGIELRRRRDPRTAQTLDSWLRALQAEHSERILPVDLTVAEQWARLDVPNPRPVIDSLQAATAMVHGLTFVTRNIDDVIGTGAPLLNPFVTPAEVI